MKHLRILSILFVLMMITTVAQAQYVSETETRGPQCDPISSSYQFLSPDPEHAGIKSATLQATPCTYTRTRGCGTCSNGGQLIEYYQGQWYFSGEGGWVCIKLKHLWSNCSEEC